MAIDPFDAHEGDLALIIANAKNDRRRFADEPFAREVCIVMAVVACSSRGYIGKRQLKLRAGELQNRRRRACSAER